ncbi:MAG: hypothetical protein H7255_13710, partial [Ramlibacter sp.]|nr:hypothetical protein [Ramlibacter sp.]
MTAPLIALTSYYNPFRGERRRRNYHVFRENLGVPLVTVEWSQDGCFDLTPGDADVLFQIGGGDLMWQKERLLNRGLAHIRAGCLAHDVAILDADVVFDAADWHQRVSAALAACPIVHCQSRVDYLPELPAHIRTRGELAGIAPERTVTSLSYAMSQGKPLFTRDPATAKAMAVNGVAPASGA